MNQSSNFITTQAEVPSLLVGKRVAYTITKDTISHGFVLDKGDIKNASADNFTVTGYMIEDDTTHEIIPIAYWRIKKILHDGEGHLKGGFNRSLGREHA